jgi:dihydrofolate synthase/folylpolyglutamate synthase
VPDEATSWDSLAAAERLRDEGVAATSAASVGDALAALVRAEPGPLRVLICGSLYLAGEVLRDNA